jgi:8-oxo-dGTP pyrophosphatase MutT (NUDIX family)
VSAGAFRFGDMFNLPGRIAQGDPDALAVYHDFQDDRIGANPLAEGAKPWPAWTATGSRRVRADRALTGWRMWAVADTDDGPRLVSPFITSVVGAAHDLEGAGLTWQPGRNVNSTYGCAKAHDGHHPLVDCQCGLRVVRSLTVLRALATTHAHRVGPMVAYAEVDVWGHVAPFAPDDDWRHTLRAEHAAITGPLHLDYTHAGHAGALAEHYGIEVIIEPPACTHWGEHGAAGLLLVDKGNVLLQLRPEGIHEGGTWSIPGGALGDDESPEDGALREAAEETGIDPADVDIIAVYTDPCDCGWTYETCIANPTGTLELAANWESQELRWVPLEDVDALDLHPGLKGAWPDLRDIIDAQDSKPNITQITERIWTGGSRGHTSPMAWLLQLEWAGISHVIDCRPEGVPDQAYARDRASRIDYCLNGQDDDGRTMPDEWFDTGVDFALEALKDPDAMVLAHCHMGINRGPSMALAILLATGMDPDAALIAITDARPIAQIAYADDAFDWWTRRTT